MNFDLMIDGDIVSANEEILVRNPANKDLVGKVGRGTSADANTAIKAAKNATSNWGNSTPGKRERVLHTIADRIEKETDELAQLLSKETGKCLNTATGEVEETVQQFRFYAGITDKVRGDTIPTSSTRLNYTKRVPYGVTSHIIPWNYPLLLGSRGIAAALATGNTIVAKPPTLAPLSTMYYGEMIIEETPAGVANLVPGPGSEVGSELAENPNIDLITFTGSNSIGIRVLESAAGNVTPADVEMGGKTPAIVLEDANIENTARGIVSGIFSNAGQNCVATSRLIVHNKIHDELVEKIVELTEDLQLGEGIDPDTDMGPVISEDALENILNYIQSGKEEGATLLTGGSRPKDSKLQKGHFINPTIFGDVTNDMEIAQQEIFGPVLSIISVSFVEDAIQVANNSKFALAASLWTDSLEATRIADDLDHGMVSINTYPISMPQSPWGGNKQSGIGREGGVEGAESFTRVDSVVMEYDTMADP